MKWLLAALGLIMVAAGGYWAFTGSLIVQVERGWSAVIAGSVVFSTGFLILAVAALMGAVNRLAEQMRAVQSARPRPAPAIPQPETVAVADKPPVAAVVAAEPEDKAQLRLELVSSPAPTPIQQASMAAASPPANEKKPSPVAEPALVPKVETLPSPTLVDISSAPAMTVEEPAALAPGPTPKPEGAPPKSARPVQSQPVRPVMPRPAPPSPVARQMPPPPPTASVRPIHPALAPPTAPLAPPPAPPAAQTPVATPAPDGQQPTEASPAESEAPVPAPRPASEARKVGWLERALESAAPDEPASQKPAATPSPSSSLAAPTPRPASPKDAPVKPAETQTDVEKPTPAPSPVPLAEAKTGAAPKAEATASQATASALEPVKPTAAVVTSQPAPDLTLPPEPVRLPTVKPDELEQAPPAKKIPEPSPVADLPKIMRKYESQGVSYTLYEDGSIDADSTAGRFRFASLDELRVFLENKN